MTLTQLLQRCKWTLLEYQPYNPNLAPSVYYTLPAVKDYLSGHHTAQI